AFHYLRARERGAEIVDVALQLGLAGVADRPDTHRLARGGDAVARIELGIELGETFAVGAALERIVARLHRTPLESGQYRQQILRPRDRLAELAVAHHVEAGLGLPAHHLADRLGQAVLIGGLVIGLPALPRADEFEQFRRPDQAADMGGENPIGAAL